MRIQRFLILLSIFAILCVSAPAYVFEPDIIDGKEYISLNDICDLYGFSFQYESFPGKVVLTSEDDTIVLLLQSQRFLAKGKVYVLDSPLTIRRGVIFIPADFVSRVFGEKVLKTLAKKEEFKIKTIVIDPGHGGRDPGAVGARGLMEKEINLDIALELKTLINSRLPVKVLMTREKDVFIPLADRTKFANRNGAQLFISIHCNASLSKKTYGCETYYVSESDNAERGAAAVLENSVIKLEMKELGVLGDDMLRTILQDMTYHEYVHKSISLASYVQAKMSGRLNLTDRGVKHDLFYVLRGVAAPSILVEVAFLSYPQEEAKLANSSFRKKAAEAIFEGIKEYMDSQAK